MINFRSFRQIKISFYSIPVMSGPGETKGTGRKKQLQGTPCQVARSCRNGQVTVLAHWAIDYITFYSTPRLAGKLFYRLCKALQFLSSQFIKSPISVFCKRMVCIFYFLFLFNEGKTEQTELGMSHAPWFYIAL